MLDDQETLKRFGYLATAATTKGRRRVIYRCSNCHKPSEIYLWQYKGENHICAKCAMAKCSFLPPNQATDAISTLSNLDDPATLKRFGYLASSLKPHSNKLIIYICNHCYRQLEARRSDIQSSTHLCLPCNGINQKTGKNIIAQDIRRVTKELGHQPTTAEYEKLGKYHFTTVRRNFGKDWAEILEEIGFVAQRKQYSIAEIEREVKKVKAQLGKIPNSSEYKKVGQISAHLVKKVLACHNWLDVIMRVFKLDIEMAKSSLNYGQHPYQSTEQRLKELKALANKLGRSPSCREAEDAGITPSALYKRLKTDWQGILQAAGLDTKSLPLPSKVFFTKAEDIVSDIRQVAASIGKLPTQREYLAQGKYGIVNLYRHFPRWIAALTATGLDLKEKYQNKKDNTPRPTSYYLEQIRQFAQKLGHAPTTQQATKNGIKIIKLYKRLQCSWPEILQQAGLTKQDLPLRARFLSLSDQEVLADVKRVAIELGCLPTKANYREKGSYSDRSVTARFGGNWSKVLAAITEDITEILPLVAKQKEQSLITKNLLINPIEAKHNPGTDNDQDSLENIANFFQQNRTKF